MTCYVDWFLKTFLISAATAFLFFPLSIISSSKLNSKSYLESLKFFAFSHIDRCMFPYHHFIAVLINNFQPSNTFCLKITKIMRISTLWLSCKQIYSLKVETIIINWHHRNSNIENAVFQRKKKIKLWQIKIKGFFFWLYHVSRKVHHQKKKPKLRFT